MEIPAYNSILINNSWNFLSHSYIFIPFTSFTCHLFPLSWLVLSPASFLGNSVEAVKGKEIIDGRRWNGSSFGSIPRIFSISLFFLFFRHSLTPDSSLPYTSSIGETHSSLRHRVKVGKRGEGIAFLLFSIPLHLSSISDSETRRWRVGMEEERLACFWDNNNPNKTRMPTLSQHYHSLLPHSFPFLWSLPRVSQRSELGVSESSSFHSLASEPLGC